MGDNEQKRIGRPPIPEDQRKTRLLHVRLTVSDYATLASAADRAGVKLATWIRRRLGLK
jgi:predicted HicB family RNase H-like nuclease